MHPRRWGRRQGRKSNDTVSFWPALRWQRWGSACGAAQAQPVELTFANALSLPQVEPYQKAVDEFNAANPDIKVTMINAPWSEYWQQRQVDTASGKLPDIWLFVPGFGAQWLYGDQLLPLNSYIADADPTIDLADANQTMLKYLTLNDKLYGIGYDFNGQVVYYNPELFDEAGVPHPAEGWTTDDLNSAARTISEQAEHGQPQGLGPCRRRHRLGARRLVPRLRLAHDYRRWQVRCQQRRWHQGDPVLRRPDP